MHISALYESVTNSIIADLEKGVASWVKPWTNGNTGGILPMNAATKRSYNGINIPILWHAQITNGYKTAHWMTYKQAVDYLGLDSDHLIPYAAFIHGEQPWARSNSLDK